MKKLVIIFVSAKNTRGANTLESMAEDTVPVGLPIGSNLPGFSNFDGRLAAVDLDKSKI